MKRTLVALLPLVLLAACTNDTEPSLEVPSAEVTVSPQAPSPQTVTPAPEIPSQASSSILAALEALPIDDGYYQGYVRELFGDGWLDPDGNGCDGRIICTPTLKSMV